MLTLSGCNRTNEVIEPVREPVVSLTVSNLPRLEEGEGHYQAWARFIIFNRPASGDSPMHDSAAVSLGEFNIAPDGQHIVGLDGRSNPLSIPASQNAQLLDDVIITIQSNEEGLGRVFHEEPGPAILGGKITGDASLGIANLTVSYTGALGSSFQNVTGAFTIMAPTSPADSNSGVWFMTQGSTTGLVNLPALPDEWMYEGWVGKSPSPGSPVQWYSTGKFASATGADADSAGPGRGPGSGLNFPGQDFIVAYPGGPGALPDLRTYQFMITIEPVPDNSNQPFFLAVLATEPPQVPLPHGQTITMNNEASSLPSARVTVVRYGN